MAKKTIDQVDVSGRRVLMRVDFNVPVDDQGNVTDDRRIRMSLPTIHSVIDRGGRLVLISHLGRPEGRGYEKPFSLEPVATRLGELLPNRKVTFAPHDCVGAEAAAAVGAMKDGEIVVLENLRFHAGEERNDASFAGKLAAFGEIYCNDAFGTAHRKHASMVAVPQAMSDHPRAAGLLMRDELKFLSEAMANPERPFVAVIGGAKVSDKIGVIRNLLSRVDTILIGGAMAYTFLAANEVETGSSLVQRGMIDDARKMIDEAAASKTELILPEDHVCGRQITSHTPVRVVEGDIPEGWMGLDIGPKSAAQYLKVLSKAKTVVWNGPMGAFETQPFDVGTRQVATAIAEVTGRGGTTIVGGGDSAAAVEGFGLSERFSHVSTGGGASLEMLEGKVFPALALIEDA